MIDANYFNTIPFLIFKVKELEHKLTIAKYNWSLAVAEKPRQEDAIFELELKAEGLSKRLDYYKKRLLERQASSE